MTEKSIEDKNEADGRTVKIDTGYYSVQVWGDPDDSLDDVKEAAFDVADRARADVAEMDDSMDDGDNVQYR